MQNVADGGILSQCIKAWLSVVIARSLCCTFTNSQTSGRYPRLPQSPKPKIFSKAAGDRSGSRAHVGILDAGASWDTEIWISISRIEWTRFYIYSIYILLDVTRSNILYHTGSLSLATINRNYRLPCFPFASRPQVEHRPWRLRGRSARSTIRHDFYRVPPGENLNSKSKGHASESRWAEHAL